MTIVERNLEYSLMFQCLPFSSFTLEHPLCDKNFSLMGGQNGVCSLNNAFVKFLKHIGHENDGSIKYKKEENSLESLGILIPLPLFLSKS